MDRALNAYQGSLNIYGPTKTHLGEYDIARDRYDEAAKRLKKLIEVDFVKLQQKLDEADVPWTPGRRIPQLGEREREMD